MKRVHLARTIEQQTDSLPSLFPPGFRPVPSDCSILIAVFRRHASVRIKLINIGWYRWSGKKRNSPLFPPSQKGNGSSAGPDRACTLITRVVLTNDNFLDARLSLSLSLFFSNFFSFFFSSFLSFLHLSRVALFFPLHSFTALSLYCWTEDTLWN